MKDIVYVAIWEDRHVDTGVFVFSNKDKAIEWAKKTVREYDRFKYLDEELTELMKKAGWLYRGCYSCEGDHIIVRSCEIDKAVE